MRQVNYICSDMDLNVTSLANDIINTFADNRIAPYTTENGTIRTSSQIYYDTPNFDLLKSRGFCRTTIGMDVADRDDSKNIFLEFKMNADEKTTKIDLEEECDIRNIADIVGIQDIKEILSVNSINYHHYFQKVDLELMFTNRGSYVDYIMQATTIRQPNSDVEKKVAFFSLVDQTATHFREDIARQYDDKTKEIFDIFEKTIDGYDLQKVSNNRYNELMQLVQNPTNENNQPLM